MAIMVWTLLAPCKGLMYEDIATIHPGKVLKYREEHKKRCEVCRNADVKIVNFEVD